MNVARCRRCGRSTPNKFAQAPLCPFCLAADVILSSQEIPEAAERLERAICQEALRRIRNKGAA